MLDLPSVDGRTLVKRRTRVTFLDEFRMMILTPRSPVDVPEFTVFDTITPCGHPANSRQFRLPRHPGWGSYVHVGGDRCLGTLDQDRPLIADPIQAVVVIELVSRNGERVFIIVRIQTLVEHVCSMDTDGCVPWDKWGRYSTVMEIPKHDNGDSYPLVQGTHVVLVEMYATPRLRTFDFSRWGRGVLPLLDEGDGTGRRAVFEDGRNFLLQGSENVTEWGLDSLGDGKFVYLVSCFHPWGSGGRLMVW